MLTNITIENFKCHQHTDLELKPLTILTGINGFGKSSVIQSLLLLRQSYTKGLLSKGVDLNMPLVNIGIVDDALYKLTSEPIIKFSICYCDNKRDQFVFSSDEKVMTDSFIPLKEHIGDGQYTSESLFNNNFQYISALRLGGQSVFGKNTVAVTNEHQISSEMGKGELVGHFLYEYQNMLTHNFIGGTEDIPLIEQVKYWEQKISKGITFNVEQSSDYTSYVIKYGYEREGGKPIQNLRAENIGFGVSYTLPVIVAILSAKKGDLIIIENPEAHLHPDAQLELGNLICMAAQYGVQIIIETHSDHIVNAAQIACKQFHDTDGKNGISKNNVAIHYFGSRNEGLAAKSEQVKIQDDGSVEYQPKGFFDTIEYSLNQLY